MTQPLASRLPRLARGEAAFISLLAESASALRLSPAREAAVAWIAFQTEPGGAIVHLSPLASAETPLRLTADDGQPDALRAAAAMEAVEPVIAAIEAASGRALRPVRISSDTPAGPSFRVEGSGCSVLLAVAAADDAVRSSTRAAPRNDRVAALPTRVMWSITASALPADAIADLGVGDLLLVQPSAPADLICGDMRWAARADLTARTLTIDHSGSRTLPSETEAWTQVRMPVELVIDGGAVTVGRLATLAPGSVLELDGRGDILSVELRSGGAAIGRGELVAVGDGFGVILTEVSAHAAPAPTPVPAPAPARSEPADA